MAIGADAPLFMGNLHDRPRQRHVVVSMRPAVLTHSDDEPPSSPRCADRGTMEEGLSPRLFSANSFGGLSPSNLLALASSGS
jgi:hypothetical protein